MLRRCIWELSSSRSTGRSLRKITAQTPFFLSSRNGFSTVSPKKSPQTPAPPPQGASSSGSSLNKLVVGSAVVGAAVMAAYQTGHIGLQRKDERSSSNDLEVVSTLKHSEHSDEHATLPSVEKPSKLKPSIEDTPNTEDVGKTEHHHLNELEVNHETVSEIKSAVEDAKPIKENELSTIAKNTTPVPDELTDGSKISSEGNHSMDNNTSSDLGQNNQPESSVVESSVIDSSVQVSEESATREAAAHQDTAMEVPKVSLDEGREVQTSLADSYSLHADEVSSGERQKTDALAGFLNEKEVSVAESGKSKDQTKPDDERIVLNFIEAIHVAEERQAERDAHIFSEEKRKLKEKYEKELKDARARELMYAEEAAILEKVYVHARLYMRLCSENPIKRIGPQIRLPKSLIAELNKEKAKAAAAIKSLQEKAEQKLQEELQRKEEEADIQLKEARELAKAELAAAIAKEKASQIEKIAEANMNINALCMAFYARSEEARQTHSAHKLALGTLALEDALSLGLPIRAEVDTLHLSVEGIDKDSLLHLVLSSLPEEVLNYGTDTYLQLNQKFDSLKGTLRHFSLIPAGGGGLLAHGVAHIASSIKMKEDQCGHGIESVISKIDSYLVQGKFAEAAEALEGGVSGTEAEKVVVEWVRQARNRAVVEQALSLIQSYAASIIFS